MKNIKKSRQFIYFILLTLILSCNTFGKNELENLQDNNFYFQRFVLLRKGINEKVAFETMKSFPIERVLAILAHKYNISIDSSEFDNIIKSNAMPRFKETMMFDALRKEYEWESSTKNQNNIEISYHFLLGNASLKEANKIDIIINANGKVKEAIYGDVYADHSAFEYIAKRLDYTKVNPKSDDVYINNETRSQIDFTKVGLMVQTTPADKNVNEKNKAISEETIKQDIKK